MPSFKTSPWSSLVGAVRELLELNKLYLVGRLDRETSGVVLIAKTRQLVENGKKH